MNLTLQARHGKFLAVALLLLTAILAYMLLVSPWLMYADGLDQRMEQAQLQLTRLERMAAKRPAFEEAIARFEATSERNRFYLKQSSPALALAELEQHLEQLLRGKEAQIVSTQGVPQGQGGEGETIVLKVRMRADLVTLVNLFYQLETGSPMLFIEKIMITAPPGTGRAQTAVPANTALDVQFDLAGFLIGEVS